MRTLRLLLLPLVFVAFLVGCGGGSSDGGGTAAPGTASIVLSDEGLDALAAFEADVTSIVFVRADGSEVSVLPNATRVDFVELTEVAELVSRTSIAPGSFTGVRVTFDFANSTVLIADSSTAASLVDAEGNRLDGELEVLLGFPRGERPGIQTLRNHVVQLDLDLSQAVDVDVGSNQVTFRPVVSAVFDPADPRPLVGRGRLVSGDPAAMTFSLERLARDGSVLAEQLIRVRQNTLFQVDGVVQRGAAGLASLSALAAGSRIYVQGSFDATTGDLAAASVEAGLGVPGGGQDQLLGWIVARSAGAGADATLTVQGNTRNAAGTERTFNARIGVDVEFGGTIVLQRGIDALQGTNDLQVGQAVMVFGSLDTGAGTMNATGGVQGIVRTLPTDVFGVANGPASAGSLSLDVARIGPLGIDRFDFDVAGVLQLDADAFVADISGLDSLGVQLGTAVVVNGWFGAVGSTAATDFTAQRLVDRSNAALLFNVRWSLVGSRTALTVGPTMLSVDPSGARAAWVWNGVERLDLFALPVPSVVAGDASEGTFTIGQSGSVILYRDFGEFLVDLQARLDGGAAVVRLGGLGEWNVQLQQLRAATCGVTLR